MSASTSTVTPATAPVTPIKESKSTSTSRTETKTETRPASAKPGPRRASSSNPQQSTSTSTRTTDQTVASPDEVARVLSESAPVLRAAKQPHIDDLSDLEVGSVNKAVAAHVGLAKRFQEEKTISKSELAAHKVTIELIRSALDLVETAIQDGDRETLASANGYTDMQVGGLHEATAFEFEKSSQALAAVQQYTTARLDNHGARITNVERLVTDKPPAWTYVVALIGGFVVWLLFWSKDWSTSTKLKDGQVILHPSHLDDWEFPVIFGVLAALILLWAMAFALSFRKIPVTDHTTVETERKTIVLPAQSDDSTLERPNSPTKALKEANAGVTQTPAQHKE